MASQQAAELAQKLKATRSQEVRSHAKAIPSSPSLPRHTHHALHSYVRGNGIV